MATYTYLLDTDKVGDETQAQNEPDFPADGTSGILRVTQNGEPVIDSATESTFLGIVFLSISIMHMVSVIALE